MKNSLALVVALLVAISSCSREEEAPQKNEKPRGAPARHENPASLESCLAVGRTLAIGVEQAEAGVQMAEMGSRLSAQARDEGIDIARERLAIVGDLLDLFERDAVNFLNDPRIKQYLSTLPGYRRQLAEYSQRLNQIPR